MNEEFVSAANWIAQRAMADGKTAGWCLGYNASNIDAAMRVRINVERVLFHRNVDPETYNLSTHNLAAEPSKEASGAIFVVQVFGLDNLTEDNFREIVTETVHRPPDYELRWVKKFDLPSFH